MPLLAAVMTTHCRGNGFSEIRPFGLHRLLGHAAPDRRLPQRLANAAFRAGLPARCREDKVVSARCPGSVRCFLGLP